MIFIVIIIKLKLYLLLAQGMVERTDESNTSNTTPPAFAVVNPINWYGAQDLGDLGDMAIYYQAIWRQVEQARLAILHQSWRSVPLPPRVTPDWPCAAALLCPHCGACW
jgi:hypothetical protein